TENKVIKAEINVVFIINLYKYIIYIIFKCLRFLLKLAKLNLIWDFDPLFSGLFSAVSLTIITYYLFKLLKFLHLQILSLVKSNKAEIVEKIQYKKISLISEEYLIKTARYIIQSIYIAALVLLMYAYITLLFSFFRFTQTWAAVLFSYILSPLTNTLKAVIGFLPNVFTIAIIFVIFRYTLKLIKRYFTAIHRDPSSPLRPKWFYADWSMPTYKIIRFLVIIFALIIIFPYLPGSHSPVFQGITVFLGVLLSFGSSSAIANIIAGIVITYMRPYKIEDVVKIAETKGRVIEKSLLITRIRTIKNIDITVPNTIVLSNHITNYSSVSKQDNGLILNTTVTMGYDIPWEKIHKALIEAALLTADVIDNPPPFVLQTSLDDFYVTYEINVHTHKPTRMHLIYSDLHKNIQDVFNREGLELLSTYFTSIRDGNKKNIPDNYLGENYQIPGFKIDPITNIFTKK
ncbi:MAG: mechanosensitive ion channel family protein, partial [Candidatus Cloacimonetes bacterium]|nr:mechanosensitive ion channel family protein [Candidatus Cloacimonadota bacterium]